MKKIDEKDKITAIKVEDLEKEESPQKAPPKKITQHVSLTERKYAVPGKKTVNKKESKNTSFRKEELNKTTVSTRNTNRTKIK